MTRKGFGFNQPDKNYEDSAVFLSEFRSYVEKLIDRNLELINRRGPEQAALAHQECVRDVIQALYQAGLIECVDANDVTTTAIQASYICRMFLLSFDKAYANTSNRLSNVQTLEDQFKL